jgi:hypothetical protein
MLGVSWLHPCPFLGGATQGSPPRVIYVVYRVCAVRGLAGGWNRVGIALELVVGIVLTNYI